jgi:hypothetical protein
MILKKTIKKFGNYNKKIKNPKTLKQQCSIYKVNLQGKSTKKIYNSCYESKHCRKYKCNDIDTKLKKSLKKKVGINYNTYLYNKLRNGCHDLENDKMIKKCYEKNTKQFYDDNNLTKEYNKLQDCNKICNNKKKEFHKNLFGISKKHHRTGKQYKKINDMYYVEMNENQDEMPDKERIEIN